MHKKIHLTFLLLIYSWFIYIFIAAFFIKSRMGAKYIFRDEAKGGIILKGEWPSVYTNGGDAFETYFPSTGQHLNI